MKLVTLNFQTSAKLSKFKRNFLTSLGSFQLKQKLSNFRFSNLKLSNFSFFPIALSNQTYPDNLPPRAFGVFSTNFIFVFGREILNLSHPTLSPIPVTAYINEDEDIFKRDDKCRGRILPVLMQKRKIGHQATSLGMTNSENHNFPESNESDVVEYCVYGTLLVTCLIILLLW